MAWDAPMKILLTNDDGPFGGGISALRRGLEQLGEVTVVCPADERSGVSRGITFTMPVRVRQARLGDGASVWTLSGTPSDCVFFAFSEIYDSPPDLVVSGVNIGLNAGVAAHYSGTVAAALDGALNGVRSVALSTCASNAERPDAVAAQAVRVLDLLLKAGPEGAWAFNVNIPRLDGGEPPICFVRQCPERPRFRFARRDEDYGRTHYWMSWQVDGGSAAPDTDVAALARGEIAVTPLRDDLTDAAALETLRNRLWSDKRTA